MPYNFVAGSFHSKHLCSRLSSSKVRFYTENGRFAFLSPILGLRGNVQCSSKADRKARCRLPISVIWMMRYERISAISLKRGPVDPKFQVKEVVSTNQSSSQKTRLNDVSYGIKIWTDLSSVLSPCTGLTDGQTDKRTDG